MEERFGESVVAVDDKIDVFSRHPLVPNDSRLVTLPVLNIGLLSSNVLLADVLKVPLAIDGNLLSDCLYTDPDVTS
uniref:DUF362 domain-containing protein n=1 Tax=Strongyloides papillosus TaxID=174720 RepID=A0A0N5BDG0_STREA